MPSKGASTKEALLCRETNKIPCGKTKVTFRLITSGRGEAKAFFCAKSLPNLPKFSTLKTAISSGTGWQPHWMCTKGTAATDTANLPITCACACQKRRRRGAEGWGGGPEGLCLKQNRSCLQFRGYKRKTKKMQTWGCILMNGRDNCYQGTNKTN